MTIPTLEFVRETDSYLQIVERSSERADTQKKNSHYSSDDEIYLIFKMPVRETIIISREKF
jgi:hypothetical protein